MFRFSRLISFAIVLFAVVALVKVNRTTIDLVDELFDASRTKPKTNDEHVVHIPKHGKPLVSATL